MYLSPEAQRLLDDVRRAHEQLIEHFSADERHRRAFRSVYEALESAVGDIDEQGLNEPLEPGGWSAARVLVHLAEHDRQIEEAHERGLVHMVEHGLDHARAIWLAHAPGTA
jgi:hypothetical protein